MSTPEEPPAHAGWPVGVTPISFANIGRLGVGKDGRLYWDGKPVETGQRLSLTWWQTILAIAASIAVIIGSLGAIAQGLDAGHNFGCKMHWLTTGCPKPE
jgi:hypothetical protein